jgi:hypothetical protein
MPVLIGSPEVVNALRKRKGNLWDDLQKHFFDMHKVPEGKECMSFWRFQAFVPVNDTFQRKAEDLAREIRADKALTRDRK